MDKESKFENKYFSSPFKKKKKKTVNWTVSSLSEFSQKCWEIWEIFSFSVAMQSTGSQDLQRKTLWSGRHRLVGCCGERNNGVHPPEEKRFKGRSLGGLSSQMNQLQFVFSLGHIVVLVGVFLVTLHVVSVNKRLYPLLQVSRLEGKKQTGVNTWSLTEWCLYFEMGWK